MSNVLFGLVQDFFGTASGNDTQTDSDFGNKTPKCVLCTGSYRHTSLGTGNNAGLMVGAATSDTAGETWVFKASSSNGAGATVSNKKAMNDKVQWIHVASGGGRDGWTDWSSFGNNSVTYNISNTYNNNYGFISFLLGGDDLNVKVGTLDLSSDTVGTTTQETVNIDMTNAVLILVGSETDFTTSSQDVDHANLNIGIGSYDGTTFRQASIGWGEEHNQADGSPAAYLNDSHIFQDINRTTGAAEYAVEWTAATSTTFTVTVRTATASADAKIGYIAIALPSDYSANVSVQDTPTSTGNQSYTPTGASGFTPEVLVQIMTLMESVDTAKINAEAGGLGIRFARGTGATDEYATSISVEDASATTDTESCQNDKGVQNDHDGSTGYEMTHTSFESGGWTDNYAQVTTNAKKTICLIIGEDDAGGGPTTQANHILQTF